VGTLIKVAFGLIDEDQVVGLPAWANSERFTVEAKMNADTVIMMEKLPPMERWRQTQLMMQSLLADRFALKSHRAIRYLPVYELTIAKGGCKMKKSPMDTGGNASYSNGRIEAHAVSVGNFAMNVSGFVGRLIVNKTNLEGTYDFTLEWAPDGADSSDSRPSIFTAFEEQLGLKMVRAKDPVDVVVIDQIQRPSAN
jgi:uncharacterized protein (TIGR03435 family)